MRHKIWPRWSLSASFAHGNTTPSAATWFHQKEYKNEYKEKDTHESHPEGPRIEADITDTYSLMNAELNILRNFATAVDTRLQKAEKAAREQDNHHYFKMFADSVRGLLDRI